MFLNPGWLFARRCTDQSGDVGVIRFLLRISVEAAEE